MYALLFLALLADIIFPVAADTPSDGTKKELSALQGTWQLTRRTTGGSQEGFEDCKKHKIIIEKDQLTWIVEDKKGKRVTTFQIVVDPKQDPKTLDRKLVEGGDPSSRGDVWLAIYSLDGEVLTLCSSTSPQRGRPTGFVSSRKGLEDLCVFDRVPPEKKEK